MAMKLELNIVEDAELRAFIREYIRNEVVGVAREQIKEAVAKAMGDKLHSTQVNALLKQVIKEAITPWVNWTDVQTLMYSAVKEALEPKLKACVDEPLLKNAIAKAADKVARELMTLKLRA